MQETDQWKVAASKAGSLETSPSSAQLTRADSTAKHTASVSGATSPSSGAARLFADAIGNMSDRDTLTGVYNRRYLEEALFNAMRFSVQRGQPLSILSVDIDRFGWINERYGHVTGDLVLQHVAQTLQKRAHRQGGWVALYDADTMVICLPGVKYSAALRCANNLRVAIMSERLPLESGEISLTCSFGVQTMEKDGTPLTAQALLRLALEKAEIAKQAGGNAVV